MSLRWCLKAHISFGWWKLLRSSPVTHKNVCSDTEDDGERQTRRLKIAQDKYDEALDLQRSTLPPANQLVWQKVLWKAL